jgi:phosphoglycerol transferase MdoB-like AlkP superfamily enzyme
MKYLVKYSIKAIIAIYLIPILSVCDWAFSELDFSTVFKKNCNIVWNEILVVPASDFEEM